MTSHRFYHGRNLEDNRFEQSLDGFIEASEFPIFHVSVPPENEGESIPPISIEDSYLELEREETAEIAGGLTTNVKGAYKFHKSLDVPGFVWHIDPSGVNRQPQQIEYSYDWISDHPGTYARIDSMMEFEVYVDGQLNRAGYFNADGRTILQQDPENVRYSTDNFAYADEEEVVVYGGDLDFSNAVTATATYTHTKSATGGSLNGMLAHFDGYRQQSFIMGREGIQGVKDMETDEKARALFREMVSAAGQEPTNYHVVVIENGREYSGEPGPIDPDEFILAYDGREIIRDPARASDLLGGDQRV